MPPQKLTVAIVEDHPEFRDALGQSLALFSGIQLLDTCKDLPAGLRLLERECPDVLLVDLGLPSGSGLHLINEARRRWGQACTSAVLTVTGNEEHVFSAICAGVKGYLLKTDTPEEWLHTVQSLANGQSPLHAGLASHFMRQGVSIKPDVLKVMQLVAAGYSVAEVSAKLGTTDAQIGVMIRFIYGLFLSTAPNLSDREFELLGLLNKGLGFRQCADIMGVSESTTKTTAKRAYQKLGASNLQSALYEARATSLIP